ncbi:retrovirus-related pol polyprotein from transposon TNT 1-94 [Tanacetum coccineum]
MGDVEKTIALKTNVYKKADSVLLLCLDNKGLREVNKDDSATGVLLKLETLYMTKSLANKLYLKKKLFTFYMHSSKKLSGHIDEFNKLIGDLANIDVDIDDKDQELMESLTLEDVLSTLNLRELKKRADTNDDGDGLFVKERSNHQGSPEERLSKKEQEEINWLCQEECEIGFCSYHMTPKGDFLFDFKEFNGGIILLGDNRACAIRGTGKVRVQMKDSSSFVLENVRYIPELKINLISLGTLSREGYTVKLKNERVKAESGEPSVGKQEKESLAQVWHKCICHISEAGLYELERRYVLGNKGLGKLEFCENCVLGKSTRNGLHEQRCLAIHSGFPYSFWTKATVTATYLINRSPSAALEKNIPIDLWLDDVKPKIIIIRDVVFNESLMYKDTLKGSSATDSGKEVEFEVELQGSRVEPTMDPHTGKNPVNEDEKQDEGPQQQNLDNYVLVCNRAKRTTNIPARYRDDSNVSLSRPSRSREEDDMAAYAFTIAKEEDTHEPSTFQDAVNLSKKDEWVHAMEEEMGSLKKNHTWELIDQPPSQKLVSCKWLYKIKEGIKVVQKPRYKARLVARWFTQRAGIDYNEVFSLDVRHTSIRVILSLTACKDYELEKLDVKMAFLHGNLKETIYVRQRPGFEEGTGNKSEIEYAKGLLRKEFDMKELGPARKILGMEIVGDRGSRTSKGTADVVLVYGRDQGNHMDVDGFVDADYAKDPNKGRSITRYMFMVHGCVVSWKATLWHVAALSTTRAEYMALTEAVKQNIWLKGLLIELGVNLRIGGNANLYDVDFGIWGNAYPYDVDFGIEVLFRPTGYTISNDLKENPIEEEPLEELKKEGYFISTEFVLLLNVKLSILRPSYVIEVANGKKVETDRIIRGCILELGDSLFTVDLIPFCHGSFDVVVEMDWLSKHKAEIVCHEKVVRIPLASGKILRVQEEQTEESLKSLKSTKLDKPKLGNISIV